MEEIKVTTAILLKGALIFVLIDIVIVSILARLVKPEELFRMKWKLIIIMAVFFTALFGTLVSIVFWDSVYSYVFPARARWIIPPVYGLMFSLVGLFFWWLSFRLPSNPVINFCLLGGLWGILSHFIAIQRGLLEKPPMLIGASPAAAMTIAAFEFIFYWCACLVITRFTERLFFSRHHHKNSEERKSC